MKSGLVTNMKSAFPGRVSRRSCSNKNESAGKFRSAGKTGLNKRGAFNLTARRSSSLPALLLLIPNVLKTRINSSSGSLENIYKWQHDIQVCRRIRNLDNRMIREFRVQLENSIERKNFILTLESADNWVEVVRRIKIFLVFWEKLTVEKVLGETIKIAKNSRIRIFKIEKFWSKTNIKVKA